MCYVNRLFFSVIFNSSFFVQVDMNRLIEILGSVLLCCMFLTGCLGTAMAAPVDHQSFQEFLESFYSEAAAQGITRETYDRAFASVTEPDSKVLEKAAYQAEFTTKIWDYLDARVNPLSGGR